MIRYTAEAERHIDALREHYETLGRVEAARNLDKALDDAEWRIIHNPWGGLVAPRPYPSLVQAGRLWIKEQRYWIAYSPVPPPAIQAILFDAADIPGRAPG